MFKWPAFSAKNPLGIIALFISLIYGMSALLLGISIQHLDEVDKKILICFIIFFPFVVLYVFYNLVTKHHKKLYSPRDFRNDDSFLDAVQKNPKDVAAKFIDDLKEGEVINITEGDNLPSRANIEPSQVGAKEDHKRQSNPYPITAYAAENLAFQELQVLYGAPIRREVYQNIGTRSYRFDGVIEREDSIVLIEAKLLKPNQNITALIKSAFNQLNTYGSAFIGYNKEVQLLLVCIIIGDDKDVADLTQKILAQWAKFNTNAGIRIFSYSELLNKYGFIEER